MNSHERVEVSSDRSDALRRGEPKARLPVPVSAPPNLCSRLTPLWAAVVYAVVAPPPRWLSWYFFSLHQLYFMVVLVSWLTLHNAMAAVVLLRHSAHRRRIHSLTHHPLFTPDWSLQEFAMIHGDPITGTESKRVAHSSTRGTVTGNGAESTTVMALHTHCYTRGLLPRHRSRPVGVVEVRGTARRRTTEPQLFELRRSRRLACLPPSTTVMAESEGHGFSTTQREDLTSISTVQRHCRTFEKLRTRHIAPKFGRLANVTTVASVDVSPPADLAATVRALVHEELQRQDTLVDDTIHHPPTCSSYYPAPFTPLPPSACVTDGSEAGTSWSRRDSFTPDQRYDQRFRPDPTPSSRRAVPVQQAAQLRSGRRPYTAGRSHQWFGERPLPVCYNCDVEGHIARYCNYRQPPRYDHSPRSHLSGFARAPTFPGSASHEIPRPLRKRSPASDRSLTPPPAPRSNRSPSPRHRYPSPPPEN
ncbi:hypothetical protein HPB51_027127 [Rhipicephalus microplus]|uniref:CCHC-type domain-containing protein n=1 Tax=Rhipicephalus microplus TaxID=6941 RepID=A0A9J6D152_RHIMP|nr:hypothetical protein HPB51_027127 [Rhipicephalus microplus]